MFLAASSIINKPSSVDSKEKLLRFHIVPRLGHLRLDEVTYAVIEDFKLALSQTAINTGKMYVGVKQDTKSTKRLSGKTINNVLTVLRRMLVVARKRGLIENVPDVEWLKSERSEVGQAARDPARDRHADGAQGASPPARTDGVPRLSAASCSAPWTLGCRCDARGIDEGRTGAARASSILMTMRYAHLAPEVVSETVRLLDGPAAEWIGQRSRRRPLTNRSSGGD